MKTNVLFLIALISLVFLSCERKSGKLKKQLITELKKELQLTPKQEQARLDSINDAYRYESDLKNAERYPKSPCKFFKKEKAKIFFVKKWNTPSFNLDESWSGIAHDGDIFWGYKIKDRIYYLYEYETSKRYFNETGDSIIFTERYFPLDGVDADPRQTCWWISTVMDIVANDSTAVDIKQFVQEATINRNNPEFNNYLTKIQNEILSMKGKDVRRKIINYTAQKLPGSPKTWDAWKFPGYY